MEKYNLEELCSIITDGTHQTPKYSENGYIFLSSKDVTTRKINWEKVKRIPKQLHKALSARLKPKVNDILLAKNGTTGVAAIVDRDEDFDIYVSLALLRPKEMVYPKYLLYAVNSPQAKRQFDRGLKGIGVPNLHLGVIRKAKIPLPQYETQQKIVKQLELADKLIETQKEQLEQYDALIKSRFVEMFGDLSINPKGWSETNISEIIGGKVSNGFFAKRDDYIKDGNVSVLGVANVVNRMYSQCENLPKTNGTEDDIKKFQIQYGDLLFCRSSLVAEGIGKASVVPEYIQMLTTMEYYRNQIISHSKTATMTTIGQDGILKTSILLPPLKLQKQFLDFIKQVNKLKAEEQRKLEKTQILFDSLMQQYFG